MRVYEQTATTDAKTSIDRIDRTGTDVTGQFTITRNGNKITATANKDYLAAQVGLKVPKQLTLLIPGRINYANGGGAAQVRSDYGKQAGDELTFCDNPQSSTGKGKLTNAGSESVNNETQATNEPYICGYVPPMKKIVIAEGSQGGANQDVDGKTVYPGQKVEYRLTTTPELPTSLAYSIVTVSDTDTYDQYLLPDEQTLEVTDLSTGRQMTVGDPQMNVPGDYVVTWDKDNHRFTVTYSSDYVKAHWKAGSNPRVQLRFKGTVSKTAPKTVKVCNQWELTLNNMVTPSNRVENTPPSHTPDKKDTQSAKQGSPSVSIDGKTMLLGDTGNYTVTLDLKQKDNAYKVWRAGITDDYDERYVTINPQDITVLSDTGKDVTSQFNIQVSDGVAYVYARRVDTWIAKRGVTVKGDPQPTDLKEYSSSDEYDPLNDPAIDQTLLSHTYQVVMPYTVTRVESGVVVENTAIQVTNDTSDKTNTVTNPPTPINPTKDVTVKVGGPSVIVTGTLKGVSEGGKHTDRVKVTGTPLVTCPVQEDQPFAGNTGDGKTDAADTAADGKTSNGQATQALERVTVDGTERCADTQVTSNTDDWNGYRVSRLAQTGATVLGVLALALTIGPAGVPLAMLRRRHAGTGHATTTTA